MLLKYEVESKLNKYILILYHLKMTVLALMYHIIYNLKYAKPN